MTPREAYEEDCRRKPCYHEGTKRRAWEQLPDWIQGTWIKNPTPHTYQKGEQMAFNCAPEKTK